MVGGIGINQLNIINEKELFALDYDNHKITNTFIGDARLVTVDNFFKNPEKVRDFSFSVPFTKSERIMVDFPGVRSNVLVDAKELENIYNKILFDEFNEPHINQDLLI